MITEKYINAAVNHCIKDLADFPEDSINRFFCDLQLIHIDIENKILEYSMTVPDKSKNRIGSAHGGYQAGLMDEIMGWGLHIFAARPEYVATTSEMSFNCLKAMYPGDKIVVKTYVLHSGKRTGVTRCEIFRGSDLCAVATENWAVLNQGKEWVKNESV